MMVFFEQPQIIIRRMKDQFAAAENFEKRDKIDGHKRIHQHIAIGGADLDQADLFRIGMEAVSFSIKCKPLGGAEFR